MEKIKTLEEMMIVCPHCYRIFGITEEEQHGNETLNCPHCQQPIETD